MNPAVISQWLTVLVQTGTVIGLVYAFIKFAGTPNATQNARLTALEAWQKDVDKRLEDGNKKFDENKKSTKVTMEALLALLSHALDGNDIEGLKNASKEINAYLLEK